MFDNNGIFGYDSLFDNDHDGTLNSFEQGMQYQYMNSLFEDNQRDADDDFDLFDDDDDDNDDLF